MGLFNFFKKDKKAEIIATDNGLLGPTYFEGLTQQVNDARRIEIFEWRGKLISNSGNTKFRIKYYGQLHSNYDTLIVATEFAPALVVAQDIVSGQ